MTHIKYRIFISDYQPFQYFRTLKEAKKALESYASFEYSTYDSDLKPEGWSGAQLYTNRKFYFKGKL